MSRDKRPDVRLRAIETIIEVLGGRDLQGEIEWARKDLSHSDRGLISHLCYGYFRLKKRLEFILAHRIRARFKKLPRLLKVALSLGTYEILYLDRIPPYATVNWYVGFIKGIFGPSLTRLANAVLRRIDENRSIYLSPSFYREHTPNKTRFCSTYYSLPTWMVERILTLYPANAHRFFTASVSPPLTGIRVNLSKEEGRDLYQRWLNQGDYLHRTPWGFAFESLPWEQMVHLEKRGIISRQSIGSQTVLELLSPEKWTPPLWDACAGGGGKTSLLMESSLTSSLFASDIKHSSLVRLKKGTARLGITPPPLFVWDATIPLCGKNSPSTVLLDVPCSGLGVLSRRPDIKWKRKPEDIETFSSLQLKLLKAATTTLSKGGVIIYITCTIMPEENQRCIEAFLRENPSWQKIKEVSPFHPLFKREFFYGALLSSTRA